MLRFYDEIRGAGVAQAVGSLLCMITHGVRSAIDQEVSRGTEFHGSQSVTGKELPRAMDGH